MTKEQEEQSVRLMEKYGFDEEMSVSKEQSRFIALILGIAYELSDDEIAKYMDIESKNFTDVDLRRISVMLGIELTGDADKEISLGQIRDYVHGTDEENVESENRDGQSMDRPRTDEGGQKMSVQIDEDDRRLLERYQAVFEKYHISLEAAEEGDILIKNMISSDKPYSRLTNYVLNGKELSPAQLHLVLKAVKEKIPEEYIMRFALPEISAMQMEKAIEIYKMREKGEKKHRFK